MLLFLSFIRFVFRSIGIRLDCIKTKNQDSSTIMCLKFLAILCVSYAHFHRQENHLFRYKYTNKMIKMKKGRRKKA